MLVILVLVASIMAMRLILTALTNYSDKNDQKRRDEMKKKELIEHLEMKNKSHNKTHKQLYQQLIDRGYTANYDETASIYVLKDNDGSVVRVTRVVYDCFQIMQNKEGH